MTSSDNQISRRSAIALAAALAATVVTAAVAGSGLLHWQARPHAAPAQPAPAQIVHAPAPAARIDD